jgi:hypothetical protein
VFLVIIMTEYIQLESPTFLDAKQQIRLDVKEYIDNVKGWLESLDERRSDERGIKVAEVGKEEESECCHR